MTLNTTFSLATTNHDRRFLKFVISWETSDSHILLHSVA